MSSLHFSDYYLNELSYRRNSNFNPSDNIISLEPTITANIEIEKDDNRGFVNLYVKHGELSDETAAFEVIVDIVGEFTYQLDESEFDISFETFLKENALAILWSYIRPMVSDLITRGNEFPNFILPVINVKQMLEENEDILVKYK